MQRASPTILPIGTTPLRRPSRLPAHPRASPKEYVRSYGAYATMSRIEQYVKSMVMNAYYEKAQDNAPSDDEIRAIMRKQGNLRSMNYHDHDRLICPPSLPSWQIP